MADQNFISILYNELEQAYLYYVEKIPGVFDIEDIHQLRVTTKKLRALYEFIELASGGLIKAAKGKDIIGTNFKNSGRIRENQINALLLKEYQISSGLEKAWGEYIRESEKHDRNLLHSSIQRFDLKAFKEHGETIITFCLEHSEKELVTHAESFLKLKTVSVQQLVEKKWKANLVHKIRIRLKAIKPILNLLWQHPLSHFSEEAFLDLTTTEKHIGTWHDRVILVRALNGFLMDPEHAQGPIIEQIRNLILRVEEDKLLLVENINHWIAVSLKDMKI